MQVIPPITITDSMLTSTTVPEVVAATYNGGTTYVLGDLAGPAPVNGAAQTVWRSLQNGNLGNAQVEGAWWTEAGTVYPEYNAGVTYAEGDIVSNIDTDVHELYESQAAGNLGNALTDATKWLKIGATNAWAMFDLARNTVTAVPLEFTVVVAPGVRFDSLALSGLSANSYSVSISSAVYGGVFFTQTGLVGQRPTLGWYDYFFGEFTYQETVLIQDIPPYSDAVLTLTLTANSGDVELGVLVLGKAVDLGITLYTAESDVMNFSTIVRNEQGDATLTARRNVPKTTQNVVCAKTRVNKVRALRSQLNAVPALWCGVDDGLDGYFDSLTIYGIYKRFSINVDQPETALLTIELEEI